MSEAVIFDVNGSDRLIFRIDSEGDIDFTPSGVPGSFEPGDKTISWQAQYGYEVGYVTTDGEMRCTREMVGGMMPLPYTTREEVGLYVLGLGGTALLAAMFILLPYFSRRSKTLRTTTDAQPGNPIIRVELPGVVRGRSY